MALFDDRFSLWSGSPDGTFSSPQVWPPQWAPAPMLQGTAGLIGAGNLKGFAGSDGSDTQDASAAANNAASAPLSPAPPATPAIPLPQPRPIDAPGADATSVLPTPSDGSVTPLATRAASDPSLFDRLSAAVHNFRPGRQGIIPGLFDASSGLMTGRRFDPAGQAQQTQNQTAAALQSRGLAPEVADAVARNPDMLRQVAAQLLGPKQYQHVLVRDAQGNIVPLTFDAASGRYRDASGNPLQPGTFAPATNPRGSGAVRPSRYR